MKYFALISMFVCNALFASVLSFELDGHWTFNKDQQNEAKMDYVRGDLILEIPGKKQFGAYHCQQYVGIMNTAPYSQLLRCEGELAQNDKMIDGNHHIDIDVKIEKQGISLRINGDSSTYTNGVRDLYYE